MLDKNKMQKEKDKQPMMFVEGHHFPLSNIWNNTSKHVKSHFSIDHPD